MPRTLPKPYLLLELMLLMFGLPLLALWLLPLRMIIPAMWVLALLGYLVGRRADPEGFWGGWNFRALTRANLRPMLLRFALCSVLLAGFTAWFTPVQFFSFVRSNPAFWALVMVLYPLFSVIPQEMFYRRFIFARYGAMVADPRVLIAISAVGFGFAHIFLQNWVAPLLSSIGGWMFAATYQRTRSLALACIEHALYGNAVFTVGLGLYFYHGAVR